MSNTFITVLALIIVFIGLLFTMMAARKVNMPKPERGNQFLMPLIALVYCLAIMPFTEFFKGLAQGLLSLIGSFLEWLAGLGFMPLFASNGLLNGALGTQDAAMSDNRYVGFISLNIAVLLVFLVVKKLAMLALSAFAKSDQYAFETIRSICYEYINDGKGIRGWFLKENLIQARDLLKALFYFTAFFVTLLLIISSIMFNMNVVNSLFYPVFCVILVGELYFYLDGMTRLEYREDILGIEEEEGPESEFDRIRKLLKKLFGDKLLADEDGEFKTVAENATVESVIRQFEDDDDPVVNNLAEYIKRIQGGLDPDTNYLYSMRDLLQGKSILFNNPFYRDLIPYAFYPMNRTLLAHKKVLIILGRHAVEEDVTKWLEDGVESITSIPFLWKIGVLDEASQDVDIGIMTRSSVHNIAIHEANEQFINDVEFVVIMEPSRMVTTAQIGLNLLVKKMKSVQEDKNITFCLCDKNCDGLVDAMSHILMTNLTEVSATRKHKGKNIFMCWETDDDFMHHRIVPNISRYLGCGTELSFVALKHHVKKARWYGGDAFPVTDIRWIAKQYYHDLMNYAELPANQDAMNEYFDTSANMWSAEVSDENYITVEDESYNMFEMIREFSTRADEKGFVNVISSDYMLKDYMSDNSAVFEADAKAIPNTVADYARTARNITLRLLLLMSKGNLDEDTIINEFSLIGITVFNLKKQLWFEIYKCYASVDDIAKLSSDYREAVEEVSQKTIVISYREFSSEILVEKKQRNYFKGCYENVYNITDEEFLTSCISALKSAAFIAEDEKGEKNYLGSELYDHVYSKYLPGQFFTFGGKYYEMQYLTADGQVLIRRAADHIDGRPFYRQLRKYYIEGLRSTGTIGSERDVDGIKISRLFADVSVETPGYYRMSRFNDFATARKVLFDGEGNRIPEKVYRNKEIIAIDLPTDGGLTDEVRYTLTLMLNEVFRSLFAENQAYITAVTDCTFLGENYDTMPLTFSIEEDCEKASSRIYIIEDSQLDLGLITAVDRNLHKIFQIMCDYLEWHQERMDRPEEQQIDPNAPDITLVFGPDEEEAVKKGFIAGIIAAIAGLFGGLFRRKGKGKDDADTADGAGIGSAETDGVSGEGEAVQGAGGAEALVAESRKANMSFNRKGLTLHDEAQGKIDSEEKTEADEIEVEFEGDGAVGIKPQNAPARKSTPGVRMPYKERYFMLFGFESIPKGIDIDGTRGYLENNGFDNNSLRSARENGNLAGEMANDYIPYKDGAEYCDFCGIEVTGKEFDILKDGRVRCKECGKTAITSQKEFQELFDTVKSNMEKFYGIKYRKKVKVQMVNAKKLHRACGHQFVPTHEQDARILGVASKDAFGRMTLMVENGAPKMATVLTMAHEMTHIWQYENWDDKGIEKDYGNLTLQIYEGMAKWSEIQYAYLIDEKGIARREELQTVFRPDEYGIGFLRFVSCYPIGKEGEIVGEIPFGHKEKPLPDEFTENQPVIDTFERYKREMNGEEIEEDSAVEKEPADSETVEEPAESETAKEPDDSTEVKEPEIGDASDTAEEPVDSEPVEEPVKAEESDAVESSDAPVEPDESEEPEEIDALEEPIDSEPPEETDKQ